MSLKQGPSNHYVSAIEMLYYMHIKTYYNKHTYQSIYNSLMYFQSHAAVTEMKSTPSDQSDFRLLEYINNTLNDN